jgi:hypothetical protein
MARIQFVHRCQPRMALFSWDSRLGCALPTLSTCSFGENGWCLLKKFKIQVLIRSCRRFCCWASPQTSPLTTITITSDRLADESDARPRTMRCWTQAKRPRWRSFSSIHPPDSSVFDTFQAQQYSEPQALCNRVGCCSHGRSCGFKIIYGMKARESWIRCRFVIGSSAAVGEAASRDFGCLSLSAVCLPALANT